MPGFFAVQACTALSTGLLLIGVQKVIAETVPKSAPARARRGFFRERICDGNRHAAVRSALRTRFGVVGFYVMAAIALVGLGLICAGGARQPQSAGIGR